MSDGGEVLAEASVPVNPRSSAGGAVEQDPEELLESVIAAGTRALRRAGAEVEAVGLANQGETVLRWDRRSGRPYGPALSWQDRRAVSVTRELTARADRLTAVTGLPLDPYFAAPKMTWLRRNEGPEGVVTTVDAWLNWRLAGAFVTDAATASRTLLLDLRGTLLVARGVRGVRTGSDAPAAGRGLRRAGRRDRGLRARAAALRAGRGSAGGAAGSVLLRRRRGQVHLRHGRLHPRQRRRAAARLGLRARRLRGLAPARATPSTASTARSTAPARRCSGWRGSG